MRTRAAHQVGVGLAGFAILIAMAGAHATPKLVLINESPSLPKGLYIRVPARAGLRGAIVAIPQPPPARPYLAGLGMPEQVQLIKRVAAAGGDLVCAAGGAVRVAGAALPVRARDRRGAGLPAWRGCRRLGPDELFLVGDTANSFDSRYFGPVARARVSGAYRAVMSW
jgi:type IV secretory pathway protease TraF